MKKGLTLVEMLVVMGIIAILIGAGFGSFSAMTKRANKAKGQEIVSNVATALEAIYQKEGCWPHRILAKGSSDGEVDAEVAYDIAKRGMMSLTIIKDSDHKTGGLDRFGIVTPWAANVIKKGGAGGASESSKVPTGGTVRDHRLHFAVDDDDDGYVNANVGGTALRIRASAAVWSIGMSGGKDGKPWPYWEGLRRDDIYSWSKGQVK